MRELLSEFSARQLAIAAPAGRGLPALPTTAFEEGSRVQSAKFSGNSLRDADCLAHPTINRLGELSQVLVALRVIREPHKDVVPPLALNDGRVMQPVFPGTPFAAQANLSALQAFNEFDWVVRNLRRIEDFAHSC